MKRLHRIVSSLCLSLLLFVTCSSLFSVKASALEVSPDLNDGWFLIPLNYYSNEGKVAIFDDVGGVFSVQGTNGSNQYYNFTTDYSGGVFPVLTDGHEYLVYLTLSVSSSSSIPFDSFRIRNSLTDNNGLSFRNSSSIFYDVSYSAGTTSYIILDSFVYNSEFSFSNSSTLVVGSSSSVAHSGRVSWSLFLRDITDNSVDEVNQIIAAIEDQTDQIKDKIDEVLTPEGENNLGEAVDQITDQVQENLGALGFAHDTVENFIGLFNEEPPAPIINVPPLKMKIKGVEHQFFNGYQYDFRSMEDNGLSVLVGAVRTAGTLVLWWAFLQYCLKEFDGFFRR